MVFCRLCGQAQRRILAIGRLCVCRLLTCVQRPGRSPFSDFFLRRAGRYTQASRLIIRQEHATVIGLYIRCRSLFEPFVFREWMVGPRKSEVRNDRIRHLNVEARISYPTKTRHLEFSRYGGRGSNCSLTCFTACSGPRTEIKKKGLRVVICEPRMATRSCVFTFIMTSQWTPRQ